jgi:hypothetical protein
MPKTIIFCADGTWDGPSQTGPETAAGTSNVYKLYLNLAGNPTLGEPALDKEQEKTLAAPDGTPLQVAKYINGVGDSGNALTRLLGGAIGAGLIERIVRGYTFISRNYRQGDAIIVNGFSRGAYTARALAGLIVANGLLDATKLDLTDRTGAYRLGSAVWYAHLHTVRHANTDRLGRLQEWVIDLPGFFAQPPAPDQMIPVTIDAVGVWDTVGALGIPQYTADDHGLDAFKFADTMLSPRVGRGIHAVSVDERRADFTPTLWDPDPRITQVLFPGAHSDVGGGSPLTNNESGLSDASLIWMTAQLEAAGVRFADPPAYLAHPSYSGPSHTPWTRAPWTLLPTSQRAIPPGLAVSESLVARLAAGPVVAGPGTAPAPYRPSNLWDYLDAPTVRAGVPVG